MPAPCPGGQRPGPGSALTLALPGWQGEFPVLSARPLRDEDGVEQGACLMGALVKVSHGDGSSDADVGRDDGQLLALRIQVAGVGPGLGPWGAGAGDLR